VFFKQIVFCAGGQLLSCSFQMAFVEEVISSQELAGLAVSFTHPSTPQLRAALFLTLSDAAS
jgi:hypothetical protein